MSDLNGKVAIKFAVFTVMLSALLLYNSCHREDPAAFVPIGLQKPKSLVDTSFNRLLEQQIKHNIEQYQCPGLAVLVMQGDQVIFEKQFGSRSRYSKEAIDSNTLFRLGSVSKGFAGILVSLLAEKNVISLEDPVSLYIPELKIKARNKDKVLRIKHIMSHSSGLTEHAYSNLVDENRDIETIFSYLNRLTPRDSTGKAYAYQNATFGLIEKVIENATGMSYTSALDFYLLSPLGMCRTSYSLEGMTGEDNVCHGHKYGKGGFVPINLQPHYYNLVSAGGINAPMTDMRIWLNAVMGFRPDVISPTARNIAFSPYVNTTHDDKYFNMWPGFIESHYGLGWRLIRTNTHNVVYHGGMVNGFRTEIGFDPEKEIGIVFLFNSVCNYSNNAVHQFFDLWDVYHLAERSKEDYL